MTTLETYAEKRRPGLATIIETDKNQTIIPTNVESVHRPTSPKSDRHLWFIWGLSGILFALIFWMIVITSILYYISILHTLPLDW